ncbi:MAG: acyl-CoA desaturase [Oleiphilaceae bacterium]|nr:acyl-CoA desaturase [Oleiphilaceae bacterium]
MSQIKNFALNIVRWFDSEAQTDHIDSTNTDFNWIRVLPFIALHLACLGVIWVGISPFAVWFAVGFFLLRMFAITGFYHRYFAHKTFKANRGWQLVFAILGASAAQRGPLWWAAHHRHHHQHSDEPNDLHSPTQQGFWWSHLGWFTCDAAFRTDEKRIKDWMKFPELRFINRFDALVPLSCILLIYGLGELLAATAPLLGTNGPQLLIWGFFISTVALFHGTVSINSLAHVWGRRRFNTPDSSRNNFLLALVTLGEGWHNNHHRWPGSARQGFRWYEVDITYYVLWLMSKLGIIYDLKPIPQHIRQETLHQDQRRRSGPVDPSLPGAANE